MEVIPDELKVIEKVKIIDDEEVISAIVATEDNVINDIHTTDNNYESFVDYALVSNHVMRKYLMYLYLLLFLQLLVLILILLKRSRRKIFQ